MAPGSISARSGAGRVAALFLPISEELAAGGVFHERTRSRTRAAPLQHLCPRLGQGRQGSAVRLRVEQAACRAGRVRRAAAALTLH